MNGCSAVVAQLLTIAALGPPSCHSTIGIVREGKNWLGRHPRFQLHFTPTSASWVNLVERFFRDINADPKPYQWTAKPDAVLAKVAKAKETLRTLH